MDRIDFNKFYQTERREEKRSEGHGREEIGKTDLKSSLTSLTVLTRTGKERVAPFFAKGKKGFGWGY